MTTNSARLGLALFAPLLLLACPAAQQKETADEVTVKLRRVDVETASFERMELAVIAVVENAGSQDVAVQGGDAQLTLAGRALLEEEGDEQGEDSDGYGDLDDDGDDGDDGDDQDVSGIVTGEWVTGSAPRGQAAAYRQTEVPIRLSLPLPAGEDAFERFSAWGRMALEVKGALEVGGSRYPFGGTREVATPTLPTAVLEEAQVASLDQGEKGVAFFRVGIDNPNVFEIAVDRFAWGVTIGGKEMRELPEGDSEEVPPSSVKSIEETVQLNEASFGPEVKKLLKQQSVSYVVEGLLEVKGIQRPFRFEGEMEFAR